MPPPCPTTAPVPTRDGELVRRIRLAMYRAPRVLPPPVAVVVTREIDSWLEVGHRLGDHTLMRQLADYVLHAPDWKEPDHGG